MSAALHRTIDDSGFTLDSPNWTERGPEYSYKPCDSECTKVHRCVNSTHVHRTYVELSASSNYGEGQAVACAKLWAHNVCEACDIGSLVQLILLPDRLKVSLAAIKAREKEQAQKAGKAYGDTITEDEVSCLAFMFDADSL